MPKISVIVPVYKTEDLLPSCIESILNQTFKDFELILIDDGSPDNCGKICDEYAAKDSRVKVIHKENGGPSKARNAALDVFCGDYVTFIDSDDLVPNNYLSALYNLLIDNDAEISACTFLSFKDDEEINNILQDNSHDVICYNNRAAVIDLFERKNMFVSVWGKLFVANLWQGLRFDEKKFVSEDDYIIPQLLYKANKIAYCHNRLYYYRCRSGSLMRKDFNKSYYDVVIANEELMDFFKLKRENEIVRACKENNAMLIARLSIIARHEGVYDSEVPEKYRISKEKAWRNLRKYLSEKEYASFLATYRPEKLVWHERWVKIKKIMHLPIK